MSGVVVSSVSGQTGRGLKCVDWIINAYRDLQTKYPNWLWLFGEWHYALTPGTSRYTGASFSLTRWGRWVTGTDVVTIYDPAIGVADESAIPVIEWQTWRRRYGRGTQTAARPCEYAISPGGEICFGPVPDKAYVVSGEYYKCAQVLAANADTPEMPEDHHMAIVWMALLTLDETDEASIAKAQRRIIDAMRRLELAQLPQITLGGEPLA